MSSGVEEPVTMPTFPTWTPTASWKNGRYWRCEWAMWRDDQVERLFAVKVTKAVRELEEDIAQTS